jgi:hypothetical protein
MKTCPVCQKTLTDTAKFCYFCGASLSDPVPEAPVPADTTASADLPEDPAEPIVLPDPAPEPVIEPEPVPVPEPEPEPTVIPEPVREPVPEPVQEQPESPAAVPVDDHKQESIIVATDSHSLMTTPGYIFTTILFHIPVIGLIFMIVWGCGKTKNISRKRFSLAVLIMRLILYIVVLAAAVFVLICFSGVINSLWEAVKPILFA